MINDPNVKIGQEVILNLDIYRTLSTPVGIVISNKADVITIKSGEHHIRIAKELLHQTTTQKFTYYDFH